MRLFLKHCTIIFLVIYLKIRPMLTILFMILKELMIWLPHAILTVTAVRDFGMLKNFGLATIQTYLIRISQFWSCPCLAMACIQTFPCSLALYVCTNFSKQKVITWPREWISEYKNKGDYNQDTCRTVLGERKMVLHVHEYDFGISQSATILIQPKACLAE